MLPHQFQENIAKIIFVAFATCLMCMKMGRAADLDNNSFTGLHSNNSTEIQKIYEDL